MRALKINTAQTSQVSKTCEVLFTDLTQQVRTADGELPSWEGLGVGGGRTAAQDATHPLPLPGGEWSVTLRNISQ